MHFRMDKPNTADKYFNIHGPDDLLLRVDYDDVDHRTVRKNAKRVLAVLNAQWEPVTLTPISVDTPHQSDLSHALAKLLMKNDVLDIIAMPLAIQIMGALQLFINGEMEKAIKQLIETTPTRSPLVVLKEVLELERGYSHWREKNGIAGLDFALKCVEKAMRRELL